MLISKHIYKAGKLYIQRSEQFRLKGVVSKFLEDLIESTVKNAVKHIEITECATFCYGELQMHSIIVPALCRLTDWFILEYPIRRGCDNLDKSGRVDFYCINNKGLRNEYNLFMELKCGRQGIPIRKNFRERNIKLWREVNSQLSGIMHEIQQNRNFYNKDVIRVGMEVITLYADIGKDEIIDSQTLQDTLLISKDTLDKVDARPNFYALWEFTPKIRGIAIDEYNNSRRYWGLLFLCRIMSPI